MWFASSPATGMDVIVHVAPGAELVALSKSSDWLFHILFPRVSLFRSVFH